MSKLSNNKWEEVLVNLFVVLLFVFINPIYALFICAFLNLTSTNINYWIFSFIFTLSFTLLFYLKDYSYIAYSSDIGWSITSFKTINYVSWSEIIYRFINLPHATEPFYWFYVKLIRTLITDSANFFVFIQYFTIFTLIAYLGKIVNIKKFVIIVLSLLFANMVILSNTYEVWRSTMAFLILMIGIILFFDQTKESWFSRIIIYSSVLFHISSAIIIVFFEIYIFFTKRIKKYDVIKLYSKEIILYTISVILGFLVLIKFILLIVGYFGVADQMNNYFLFFNSTLLGPSALFNSFSFFICMYLWLTRKKATKSDIFLGTLYFIIILTFMLFSVPDIFSRYSYFYLMGGTILIGKLITINYRLGFILLSLLCIYNTYIINYSTESILMFSERLSIDYLNPAYGLGSMILNYDTVLNFNF